MAGGSLDPAFFFLVHLVRMQPTAKGQAPADTESSPRRKSSGAAETRLRQQLQASENRRLTAETTLANLMHHQVGLCSCQCGVSLFLSWTFAF